MVNVFGNVIFASKKHVDVTHLVKTTFLCNPYEIYVRLGY